MKIIGFDFSIEKPACCIYDGQNYKFISWAWGLRKDLKSTYEMCGVEHINRNDEKILKLSSSEKMQHDVQRAMSLADQIYKRFKQELKENPDPETWICWEGLSFASSGNVTLQLGGFKYIVMSRLDELIEIDRQLTYAPTTVKKTAGCSKQMVLPNGKKKAQGKPEMIQSFIDNSEDNDLKHSLVQNRDSFRKRGDLNWIDHLDDFTDAYWLVRTFIEKEVEPILG